jgi:hypothetical protein
MRIIFTRISRTLFTCDMYMCRLRHINDPVLSSLKMEGIRFFISNLFPFPDNICPSVLMRICQFAFNCVCIRWVGPGELSRYSDSLQSGQSGDRIAVGARFSAPVQTGSGAHPAYYSRVPGLFSGGKAAGEWRWPPAAIAADSRQ